MPVDPVSVLHEWIQLGILLVTLLPFLYGLHKQNQLRSIELNKKVDALILLTEKHDKQNRKNKKRTKQLQASLAQHMKGDAT